MDFDFTKSVKPADRLEQMDTSAAASGEPQTLRQPGTERMDSLLQFRLDTTMLDWQKLNSSAINSDQLKLFGHQLVNDDLPYLQLTGDTASPGSKSISESSNYKSALKDYPQLNGKGNEESRLPQVGMVIGSTALALLLLRNAHGAAMMFGTAGGALVGGGIATLYDRYLDSKRPTQLYPTSQELQNKVIEKP